MFSIVEFCQNNLASGTQKVMEALEKDPDIMVDVIDYGCLGFCGECMEGPYALVNGEFVSAESPEKLLKKIKKQIQETEEEVL